MGMDSDKWNLYGWPPIIQAAGWMAIFKKLRGLSTGVKVNEKSTDVTSALTRAQGHQAIVKLPKVVGYR